MLAKRWEEELKVFDQYSCKFDLREVQVDEWIHNFVGIEIHVSQIVIQLNETAECHRFCASRCFVELYVAFLACKLIGLIEKVVHVVVRKIRFNRLYCCYRLIIPEFGHIAYAHCPFNSFDW